MTVETYSAENDPNLVVTMTDAAIKHTRGQLAAENGAVGVRLAARKAGCSGFMYHVEFVSTVDEADKVFPVADDLSVFVDLDSLPLVGGTEIDFVQEGLSRVFKFNNPKAKEWREVHYLMQQQTSQLIHLSRDVIGLAVPYGTEVTLVEGSFVTLVQSMGGAYTVIVNGNMVRIDGDDADALGKENESLTYDTPADGGIDSDDLWRTLDTIYDPEIPVSIVQLGLIYDVETKLNEADSGGHKVHVTMTLTAPGCGMGPVLVEEARIRLLKVPNVDEVTVELVFDPPWAHEMMSDAAKLELGVFY